MTKQDLINSVYGIDAIRADSNGWMKYGAYHPNDLGFDNDEVERYGNMDLWRPKSLKGIETNNDWVKIESEADLPREKTKCWFVHNSEIKLGTYHFGINEFRSGNEILIETSKVTHHQPIKNPLSPLY